MAGEWVYPVLTDVTGRPVIVALHDGDTFRLLLDCGCETGVFPWLRVRDVSCPELDQPGGPEAAQFTATALQRAGSIRVTVRGRSFARWVADVVIDGVSLADVLVAAGHGVR